MGDETITLKYRARGVYANYTLVEAVRGRLAPEQLALRPAANLRNVVGGREPHHQHAGAVSSRVCWARAARRWPTWGAWDRHDQPTRNAAEHAGWKHRGK